MLCEAVIDDLPQPRDFGKDRLAQHGIEESRLPGRGAAAEGGEIRFLQGPENEEALIDRQFESASGQGAGAGGAFLRRLLQAFQDGEIGIQPLNEIGIAQQQPDIADRGQGQPDRIGPVGKGLLRGEFQPVDHRSRQPRLIKRCAELIGRLHHSRQRRERPAFGNGCAQGLDGLIQPAARGLEFRAELLAAAAEIKRAGAALALQFMQQPAGGNGILDGFVGDGRFGCLLPVFP